MTGARIVGRKMSNGIVRENTAVEPRGMREGDRDSDGKRREEHDDVPGGDGVEWQFEGLGEPPLVAGLPSDQTQSVSDLQPPRVRRCRSGPPLGPVCRHTVPANPPAQGGGCGARNRCSVPEGGTWTPRMLMLLQPMRTTEGSEEVPMVMLTWMTFRP